MDRQPLQDNDLIERYLQGKLSADEEQAFEEAYLADPGLLDEVLLAEKLRDGLKGAGTLQPGAGSARGTRAWPRFFVSPQYAAAASVVAAVSLMLSATLLVQDAGRETGFAARDSFAATRIVPLVNVRGESANDIAEPSASEWTVFLLDAGFTEYDEYRASVVHAGEDRLIRRLDGLSADYDGYVALGLPGRELPPGDYEVELEGRRSTWPADRGFEPIMRTRMTIVAAP